LSGTDKNLNKNREQLCAIEFACAADATAAAQKLSQQMTWHQLAEIEIVEKSHYDKPGKPKPDAVPSRISFRVTALVIHKLVRHPHQAEGSNIGGHT
jgi:hypothetical protein